MDSVRYRAFLSYSHRDAKWGAWLHQKLESYRPPRSLIGTLTQHGPVPRRLVPIFRDREELASATDLGSAINEALRQSACQIVICSPSAARSRWVNEEVLAFKRLGREGRIFCLIVDGEPNASDDPARAQEECFPPALRFQLGADGNLSTTRTEPIAADARAGKDGRSNAKLKLIAGVLGVGFDSLRQRELHRRQRRLFTIAAAALTGMVATSALATAALIARATARRQTAVAQREAEVARQTTAFLVDLFRISDPSEARGNSLTAREVLDRGAARVNTQLTRQPEIQATLMDTLGTVYMGLGLYAQAQPLLATAANKRQALGPSDAPELAASLSHMGDLLTLRADYPGAEHAYHQAISLQSSLPPSRRDNAVLARTLFGLGSELDDRGRPEQAEQDLREALSVQRQLYPGPNEDTARTLQALSWTVSEHNLAEAIPLMQAAVAMQRGLWGSQPYPDYADALNDLGLLMRSHGDYEQSERLLRESLAMKRRLLGDPHPEIAMSLDSVGQVLQLKGDLEKARSTYLQALAMQLKLLGPVHPDVALTLDNLAWVDYASGDVHGAVQYESRALDIYRTHFSGDNPDVANSMNRLGLLLTQSSDYTAADRYLQQALDMRLRLFGQMHPEVASSLVHVAILQVATHKYSDALRASRKAADIFSSALSATNWKTAIAQAVEGAALAGIGESARAERELVQACAILDHDPGVLPVYRTLARGYLDQLHQASRAGASLAATDSELPVRPVRLGISPPESRHPH